MVYPLLQIHDFSKGWFSQLPYVHVAWQASQAYVYEKQVTILSHMYMMVINAKIDMHYDYFKYKSQIGNSRQWH